MKRRRGGWDDSVLLSDRSALGFLLVALYAYVLQALAADGCALAVFWGWLAVGGSLVFLTELLFPDAG